MRKLLRIAAIAVAGLLLLLVLAVLILPRVVDPNEFRGHVEAAIEEATGREFAIEGEVELNFFPWLGIRLGAVELGPDPGFAEPAPFARIDGAQVRIRVLPLFLGRAEVDTLVLDGLRLNLARDTEGRDNWADLLGEPGIDEDPADLAPVEEPETDVTRDPLAAIAVGGIRLTDAAVSWSDAQTGQDFRVENLDLDMGAIATGRTIPLVLGADVYSGAPELRAHLDLRTSLSLDLATPKFNARDLELAITAEGAPLGDDPVALELAIRQAGADLASDTAELQGLRLDAAGTRLELELLARNLSDELRGEGHFAIELRQPEELATLLPEDPPVELAPLRGTHLKSEFLVDLGFDRAELHGLGGTLFASEFSGHLEADRLLTGEPTFGGTLAVEPLDPAAIASDLGIELPPMADDEALSTLGLQLAFDSGIDHFMTERLELRLDDTTVTGQVGLARFEPSDIHFNLVVDELDLARYLPPEEDDAIEEEDAGEEPPESPFLIPDFDLPVEPLRAFDALGTVRVDQLRAAGLTLEDLRLDVHADGGRVDIAPLRVELYGGHLLLEAHLDATGDALGVDLATDLSGIHAAPLLDDLLGEPYISGRTDLGVDLRGRGQTFRGLRRDLDGEVLLNFSDGAIKGVNLAELITNAWARIEDEEPPEHQASSTDFSALAASIDIRDGLATNDDLALQTPGLRVAGTGSLHLASEQLDYELRAAVVRTLEGQDGAPIDDLTDLTVPIHFGGTLKEPTFRVLLRELLEMRAREAAQRALEREQERLDDIRREAEERLQREEREARRRLEEAEQRREAEQRMEEAERRLEEQERRQRERLEREQEKMEERARDLLGF